MLNLLKSIQIIYSLQNWDWKFSVTFTRRRCWKSNGIHSSEIRDLLQNLPNILSTKTYVCTFIWVFYSLLLYYSLMDEMGKKRKKTRYLIYLYSKNIANLEAFIQGISSSTNLLYSEEWINNKYIKSRYIHVLVFFIYLSHI